MNIGANKYVRLETNAGSATSTGLWGNTHPTSSVFTIGNNHAGYNVGTAVAYCFAEVEGYSKFSSYIGRAGGADSTFVFTGFRPRFLMIKRFDAVNHWHIFDTTRGTINPLGSGSLLLADITDTEASLGATLDIYSNGFKAKANSGGYSVAAATYVYMAFAEVPFKYANAR